MNYLDLFLLLAFGWAAFQGYRKGIGRLVAGFAGCVAGALLALNFAGPLVRWVDDRWAVSTEAGRILYPYLPLPRFILEQELSAPVVKELSAWVSGWPLPSSFKAQLWAGLYNRTGQHVTLGEALAGTLVLALLKGAAVVVLFYLFSWILRRLVLGSGRLVFSPWGLSGRLLGLALGLAGQAVYLSLALGILEMGISRGWFLRFPFFLPLARELAASRLTPPLLDLFYWLKGLVGIEPL